MNKVLSKFRARKISSSGDLNESRKAKFTISAGDDSDTVPKALCEVCKKVKIKDFFVGPPSLLKMLGYVDAIIKTSDCALCCLVTEALAQSWTTMPIWFDKGMASSEKCEVALQCGEATTSEDPGRSIEILVLCEGRRVRRGTSRVGIAEEKYQPELRLLIDDAPILGIGNAGYGRRILSVCDIALMAMWYGKCNRSHLDNCSKARIVSEVAFSTPEGEDLPEPKLPPGTFFIDVQKMELLPGEDACEFVALSYVWGKLKDEKLQTRRKNIQARQKVRGLRKVKLPKTIADAINLTKELNIRFLWVDSLCIIQDDGEKESQIQSMDRIYGLASLVLVAAAGIDANVGLTGYRDSPRSGTNQYIERVQELRIVVTSPPLSYILRNSKWNTRGWTFQEWHLARRTLIFTDEQVYYVCSSTSFSEDIALETISPHTAVKVVLEKCNASTMRHHIPGRYSPLSVNSGWIEYTQLVESYSPRELTDESDTLLAISGLLNNLHRASRNRFICGMSIGLFHEALFWVTVDGKGVRKSSDPDPVVPHPTWSWASWKGAVKYGIFPASKSSLVDEWRVLAYECEAKGLVQIGTLGTPLSEPQNDYIKEGTTHFSSRPTASNEEAESHRKGTGMLGPNHLNSCYLNFQAAVATLQFAPNVINDSQSRADALLDLSGRYLGVALVNLPPTAMQRMRGRFENIQCIAISVSESRMSYTYLRAFLTLPDDTEWLNVLLVGEFEEKYYRLGVGQVTKYGWSTFAEPVVKDIILG